MKRLFLSFVSLVLVMPVVPVPVRAQSTPVNYIDINFSPITTSTSYNYNWSTGMMTLGTATGSVSSTENVLESSISDPTPPEPNGYGTFIGTARPVRSPTGGGAVLYEQSVCSEGSPACLFDGSLTYGDMVMYPLRGATLDQLTNLQSMWYIQSGCDGGGSSRFQILMSDGKNINVYFGTSPSFLTDCTNGVWMPACPAAECVGSPNMASDTAGLRWDDSQLPCGTFYQTYTEAVTCADSLGLTINAIFVITDGGWSGTNQGPAGSGQTFLFRDIQVNQVTRFPSQ